MMTAKMGERDSREEIMKVGQPAGMCLWPLPYMRISCAYAAASRPPSYR